MSECVEDGARMYEDDGFGRHFCLFCAHGSINLFL